MLINNPRIVLRTERSKLQSSRLTVTSRLHVLASISEKFVRNYLGDAEYEHTSTLESFLSAMKVWFLTRATSATDLFKKIT